MSNLFLHGSLSIFSHIIALLNPTGGQGEGGSHRWTSSLARKKKTSDKDEKVF